MKIGIVDNILPEIKTHFNYLIQKGYLSSLKERSYYIELQESFFDHIVLNLKNYEKNYQPSKSKPIRFFSVLLRNNLISINQCFKIDPEEGERRYKTLITKSKREQKLKGLWH